MNKRLWDTYLQHGAMTAQERKEQQMNRSKGPKPIRERWYAYCFEEYRKEIWKNSQSNNLSKEKLNEIANLKESDLQEIKDQNNWSTIDKGSRIESKWTKLKLGPIPKWFIDQYETNVK